MAHRVLFVDDEQDVLLGLNRALRDQPYEVDFCASAAEAIARMKENTYDVLVADHKMPGMSGADLLAWAHDFCPETQRIMLTGAGEMETAKEAVNRGRVFRFLTKPCRGLDIAYSIFEAIEERRRSEEAVAAPSS